MEEELSMIVGEGDFRYELDENWPKKIPDYWVLGQCADIDIDNLSLIHI